MSEVEIKAKQYADCLFEGEFETPVLMFKKADIRVAYMQGFEDATKWHYPSKGEVPDKTDDYLVYLERDGVGNIIIATYYVGAEEWCFCGDEMLEPVAWMPLPEPPKEEA